MTTPDPKLERIIMRLTITVIVLVLAYACVREVLEIRFLVLGAG